jgi:hypothetical protein
VIVGNPVIRGASRVLDVRMAARHGLVRRVVSIDKCEVIRSNETMAAVANFRASADVDSRHGERVRRLFRRSMRDRYAEIRGLSRRLVRRSALRGGGSAIGAKAERLHSGDTIELDVEVWSRPIRSRPGRVRNADVQRRRVTSGVAQSRDNPLLELFIAFEHGRESCANIARAGGDPDLHLIEREHVPAASDRLQPRLHRLDDGVKSFQRLERTWFAPLL